MSADRALGLLAAILVTTGQALVLAKDTAAHVPNPQARFHHPAAPRTGAVADAQLAYDGARGRSGG